MQPSDLPVRLRDKIQVADDCWIWTAGCNHGGYGLIRCVGFKSMRIATHVLYELAYGSIPKGLQINHKCDNPSCVNPEHLYAGTPAENVADAKAAGSYKAPPVVLGSQHPSAKYSGLTEELVLEIRRRYVNNSTQEQIASEFRIGQTTVSNIVNRKTWKHI